MKLYKKILIGFISLLIPTIVWAANAPSQVNRFTAGYIAPLIGTDWVQAPYFTATSTTATSTFANGLNLTGGCFEINGACFTGGGTNYWTLSGSNLYNNSGTNVGIGTANPNNLLQVANLINFDDTLNNTWLGYFSGTHDTTGIENTAVGNEALYSNTSGAGNSAIGYQTMYSNTSGSYNAANSYNALYYNTTGSYNTAYGSPAGFNPTNDIAQYRITNDTYMTLIGYGATKNNASQLTNSTAIGNGAQVTASNQVVIGNGSITQTLLNGNVGIGSTTPFAQLSVSTPAQQKGALPLFTVASTTNKTLFTVLGNGSVGINQSSPASLLDVGGTVQLRGMENGTGGLFVNSAAYVGVETNSPGYPLTVNGSEEVYSSSNDQLVESTQSSYASIQANNSSGSGSSNLSLNPSGGNVGIGTVSPGTGLDVVGHITDESGSPYSGDVVCYTSNGVLGHMFQSDLLADGGSAPCNSN